ncbi:hypothetical protein PUR61_18080 [Streptomyces sp. BE20]|uniref:hypothetical protein n=1 Tax=unclassified Streptomyces TaxID=2593676 RepID=UPI002E7792B4|nr:MULTISPECIES: hypothetical protein [unclassified Streptomyces]MED7947643.1 hypothetical protein [Streptomyces sp. BE303]MEE1824082.1 hypothetical protein [Streptomyces sp. BE20]
MNHTGPPPSHQEDPVYVEVWNDTVDPRHLSASLLLGIAFGLPLFLLTRALLRGRLDTAALADGYALLVGLAACVAAGAVCVRLFPPKRRFTNDAEASSALRRAALAESARDSDTTTPDRLPAAVRAELTELGLLDPDAAHDAATEPVEGTESR